MLAHLERNLRGAGMSRRTFLAMASAVAGTATLAACGGTSAPTATPAATFAPTRVTGSAAAVSSTTTAPTTAATRAAQSAVVPTAPALVTAAPTTAVGSAVAAVGPDSTKVFIDYLTAEPVDNDFNRDLYCGGVVQHMAGLLRYDQDFNLRPDLAESYANNGAVFTFKLRKDAVWSDGKPLTAQDFVFSWQRQIDPRTSNGYGSFWNGVIAGATELNSAKADDPNIQKLVDAVGVKATDDHTFVVQGDKFAGLIPNQAAYAATVVAREDEVKKYSDAKASLPGPIPARPASPSSPVGHSRSRRGSITSRLTSCVTISTGTPRRSVRSMSR